MCLLYHKEQFLLVLSIPERIYRLTEYVYNFMLQVRPATYTGLMIQRFSVPVVGEYYHIYNRGTDKRVIFKSPLEYGRFELLLKLARDPDFKGINRELHSSKEFLDLWDDAVHSPLASIGAWCLMPNHFHLLVRENTEGGISTFMQKLGTAYAMYFNSTHGRTGTLFEARYKIKHVDTDTYLHWLYAYIHLNPLKLRNKTWREDIEKRVPITADDFAFVTSFAHSSLVDYAPCANDDRPRKEAQILTTSDFPNFFRRESQVQQLEKFLRSNTELPR